MLSVDLFKSVSEFGLESKFMHKFLGLSMENSSFKTFGEAIFYILDYSDWLSDLNYCLYRKKFLAQGKD